MEIHPHHGASPDIHPTAWIAPGVHLIGEVYVAEGASVWFGSVLRGDVCSISIGRYSNVQDNSVFHAESAHGGAACTPCVVGDYVTVGHACIVHGCSIGDRVLVGMGAVVMNRAKVASETILGARTLVAEDKEIASHSLVIGIPGKVARALTAQEATYIQYSAQHYYELAQTYRQQATGNRR